MFTSLKYLKTYFISVQMSQSELEPTSTTSHSTPSLTSELLKSDPAPTVVGDGNNNRFLISLTNHITGDARADASEAKATNQIALQVLKLFFVNCFWEM